MSVDGCWKVTLSTAMGPQTMRLHVARQGEKFAGRIQSPIGDHDVTGTTKGNALNWVMHVTKPIPVKVTFDAAIQGDAMSGTAKMGIFGRAKLTGERIEASSVDSSAGQRAPIGPVTGESIDPQFNQPFIEVNELRNEPVPHRYVHGGFKGTDARFSFYFPPADRYQKRFFQNTYPMAMTSDIGPFPIAFEISTGNLGFTFASGAYYVQTNLGGTDRTPPADPAIAAYRVNAAAAKYSRVVAAELYGVHRPYGYLFGGSGGSYQVIGAAENTSGVWDGFVPFVLGTPNAIPSVFTVRLHAMRVLKLRNKFASVLDAIEPGGSGDPYAELNDEERAALKEATSLGYPLRGWWNHETLTSGYFPQVAAIMPMLDPSFVEDFWTRPGYLGSDPKGSIRAARFHFDTTVAKVIDGFPKQLELASLPERDLSDAHVVIKTGEFAGKSVPIAVIDGKTVGFAFSADQSVIHAIRPGDPIRIDNAWVLALQTYQRHQLPTPDMYGWNQFRDADAQAIYPQRPLLIGPIATSGTAGSVPQGQIHGKMLVLQALMDIDAFPWQADWYRSKVKEALGSEFEDNFALWFIDHAQHDNPPAGAARAHAVSMEGALQQALRDLSAWVEKGVRPSDTKYAVVDSQVEVPARAETRRGIQPVVDVKANGGTRADVKVAEPVTFAAAIEVPPNAGKVVAAEWDFEGVGNYPNAVRLETPAATVRLIATHAFAKPGTYFAVLRATSQREGDARTPYGRIQNIARVRVVVT